MLDVRRELRRIERHYERFQETVGEGVLWYEFSGETSGDSDTYLNEGGREWRAALAIPALWVSEYEADQEGAAEGRRYTPTLRFAMGVAAVRQAGLSDPEDARRHLNDLVQYQRTLWSVGSYQIRGRLRNEPAIIGVAATKLFPSEDMIYDTLPPGIPHKYTERSVPRSSTDDSYMVFPDHDLPARKS